MFCAWTYKTSTRKALMATISIGTLDHDFIRDWGLASCTSFLCGDCSSLSLSIVPRNKHFFIAHFITVLKYKKKVARKWHAIELCSKIWAISFIGIVKFMQVPKARQNKYECTTIKRAQQKRMAINAIISVICFDFIWCHNRNCRCK